MRLRSASIIPAIVTSKIDCLLVFLQDENNLVATQTISFQSGDGKQ